MVTRAKTERTTEGSICHSSAQVLSIKSYKQNEASSVSDVSTSHNTEKWPELTLQLHVHSFLSMFRIDILLLTEFVNLEHIC